MSKLKKLLAEQARLLKAQQQVDLDIAAAREAGKNDLRQKVIVLLKENGTTVEELFGAKTKGPAKKRRVGIPKYLCDGVGYDGRTARAVSGFDKVRVGGKIDDKKALKAGMINPAWLDSARPDVKAFGKKFGL